MQQFFFSLLYKEKQPLDWKSTTGKFRIRSVLKDELAMTFQYLLEAKTSYKKVSYLSWTSLHFTYTHTKKNRRIKISLILKLTKNSWQAVQEPISGVHFHFLSAQLLNLAPFNSLYDSHFQCLWKQCWLEKAYTYTVILDVSIMNSSKKMVHLS